MPPAAKKDGNLLEDALGWAQFWVGWHYNGVLIEGSLLCICGCFFAFLTELYNQVPSAVPITKCMSNCDSSLFLMMVFDPLRQIWVSFVCGIIRFIIVDFIFQKGKQKGQTWSYSAYFLLVLSLGLIFYHGSLHSDGAFLWNDKNFWAHSLSPPDFFRAQETSISGMISFLPIDIVTTSFFSLKRNVDSFRYQVAFYR